MHSNLFVTFLVHKLVVPAVIPRGWMAQLVTSETQKNKKLPFGDPAKPTVGSSVEKGGAGSLGGLQVKHTSEQARLKRIGQLAKLCGRDVNDAAIYLFAGDQPTQPHLT